MRVYPAEQSSISALRSETADRARLSLAFFVRNVLGLRHIQEERLHELQGGFEPRSKSERALLLSWLLFRDPKLRRIGETSGPRAVSWLEPSA